MGGWEAWGPVLVNAILLAFTYGRLTEKVGNIQARVSRLEKLEDARFARAAKIGG